MIDRQHPILSVRPQCELAGLNRATFYRQPRDETPVNLRVRRVIDENIHERPSTDTEK